jgi:anti-sigma factor RsiW
MACEHWEDREYAGKLSAYLDGELDRAEAATLGAHLRECAACAASALEQVQMKRSVQMAGKRYSPSAEFRNRIAKAISISSEPRLKSGWHWQILAVPALVVLIISLAVNVYMGRESARRQPVYSELADLHVSALASATPVDVVSTDRHTVKPWFQGKIPFSFNLPELQG